MEEEEKKLPTLCIAEKPSVAKEIANILGATKRRDGYMEGNGYFVSWTFGHLCTLYEPNEYTEKWKRWNIMDLPMIPSNFKIKVINDEGVKKQMTILESLMSKSGMLINCGDAGQEGELIQRWVMLKAKCKIPVKRLWISSLTEEAIKDGFAHLMDSSQLDTLYSAGAARAIGDWLLGMNATRAYTLKYGTGKNILSIGRVQTPTLSLIVERQKAIDNFKSEPYWEIKTNYREGIFNHTNGRYLKKEDAERALNDIIGKDLTITGVDCKNGKEAPPKLFDLTLLQVECNRKFGFSADYTLKIIQSLYEKKLTTYPRVDTNFLPNDVYPKIANILKGLQPYTSLTAPILQGGKIKKSPKVFNDKKITDHHAIIPTGQFNTGMEPDEKRVYDQVARRFIAAFYPDCEVANTTVTATIGEQNFKATGKQILKPAWRSVYAQDKTLDKSDKEEDNVLPLYTIGESGPHTPDLAEKQTQPPKYYTEADLLRAMETAGKQIEDDEIRDLMKENGIGRPSTRANIIETLYKRQYIKKDKKRILATTTGIELIDTIRNELLKSAQLTGQWEKKLRMIEDGTYKAADFISELKNMVNEIVHVVKYSPSKHIQVDTQAEENKEEDKKDQKKKSTEQKKQSVEMICPKCGKGHILKGKTAWGCNLYGKGCDFIIPMTINGKALTPKQIESIVTKGSTNLIKGLVSDDGSTHDGKIKLDDNKKVTVEYKN